MMVSCSLEARKKGTRSMAQDLTVRLSSKVMVAIVKLFFLVFFLQLHFNKSQRRGMLLQSHPHWPREPQI